MPKYKVNSAVFVYIDSYLSLKHHIYIKHTTSLYIVFTNTLNQLSVSLWQTTFIRIVD